MIKAGTISTHQEIILQNWHERIAHLLILILDHLN